MTTFESLWLMYHIISTIFFIGYVTNDKNNDIIVKIILVIVSPGAGPFSLAYTLGELAVKKLQRRI